MATAAPQAGGALLIDRAALADNYRALAAQAAPAETAAVVKADGYGLGIAEVAPVLWRAGCRTFFVALAEEGAALRKLLRTARIFVLSGPLPGSVAALRQHELMPVLNELEQIAAWRATGAPAALHVDTGMSRLGLDVSAQALLLAEPARADNLKIALVMSHLACSEEAGHTMNAEQLARFQAVRERLAPVIGRPPASLANSCGIILGRDYALDMVRAGIALYGSEPSGAVPGRFRAVARLFGRVVQLRDVDPGTSVGYGATHRVAVAARLATVAIGYADGYPRSLSNRGIGFFGETPLPLVGRVSMDLTIFDASAAPKLRPGDWIELIGDHLPVDAVAARAGTISYEVLTRLGSRLARIGFGES
ncbi:MAG: alanine racemase [Alphaproteobacteria bacterium]|nr:alanine racemase [Alphaproteobacteria bacterium]